MQKQLNENLLLVSILHHAKGVNAITYSECLSGENSLLIRLNGSELMVYKSNLCINEFLIEDTSLNVV